MSKSRRKSNRPVPGIKPFSQPRDYAWEREQTDLYKGEVNFDGYHDEHRANHKPHIYSKL